MERFFAWSRTEFFVLPGSSLLCSVRPDKNTLTLSVGEPPRTRTENLAIKSSLANEAKNSRQIDSSLA